MDRYDIEKQWQLCRAPLRTLYQVKDHSDAHNHTGSRGEDTCRCTHPHTLHPNAHIHTQQSLHSTDGRRKEEWYIHAVCPVKEGGTIHPCCVSGEGGQYWSFCAAGRQGEGGRRPAQERGLAPATGLCARSVSQAPNSSYSY